MTLFTAISSAAENNRKQRKDNEMNILEIMQKTNSKRVGMFRKSGENQIRISIHSEKRKAAPLSRENLNICIGKQLMEQQRWVCGDRVTVDFDFAKSEATISRVLLNSDGASWMLCGQGSCKGNKKGLMVRCSFGIGLTPIMKKAWGMEKTESYVPERVTTSSNGITFRLAEQFTVSQLNQ